MTARAGVAMTVEAAFTDLVERVEPRLRVALVSRYGPERGREAALLAECVAPRWLHGACDAATAGDAGALEELSDFFTRAATCGEAGFGPGVAPWAEQVRTEAAVALLALEALAAHGSSLAVCSRGRCGRWSTSSGEGGSRGCS